MQVFLPQIEKTWSLTVNVRVHERQAAREFGLVSKDMRTASLTRNASVKLDKFLEWMMRQSPAVELLKYKIAILGLGMDENMVPAEATE